MLDDERFVSCQAEYSVLVRDAERDLVPALHAYGVGLLPYYPLAAGFLTGKYQRDAPLPEGARFAGGRRFDGQRYTDRYLTETNWSALERLEAYSRERGRSLLELAFGWLTAQPVVSSVIAGATKAEQLEMNVKALDWTLTPQELAEIDRLTGKARATIKSALQ